MVCRRYICISAAVFVALVSLCGRGLANERYTVKKGDTLHSISKRFGVSVKQLKEANHLRKNLIRVNQVLLIPRQSKEHVSSVPELEEGEEMNWAASISEPAGTEGEVDSFQGKVGKWNGAEERNLFVRVVKAFLGVPYRLGGSTLKGLDCSALVKKIYEIFNVSLPRTAREQLRIGKLVRREDLQEGDLVFFSLYNGRRTHVGIYIGNNEFIHASSRERQVRIDRLDMPYFSQRFFRGVRVKELEQES